MTTKESESFRQAKSFLGNVVRVEIDRPINSKHPEFDYVYPTNYGFVPGTKAPDGEELDAYVLGISEPVREFTGVCVAIVHRLEDDDDKLIVAPNGNSMSLGEIARQVEFQEKWFKHKIVMALDGK